MKPIRIFLSHHVKVLPFLAFVAWACNLFFLCWDEKYRVFLAPVYFPWMISGTAILMLFIYALLGHSDTKKSAAPYRDLARAAIVFLPLVFLQTFPESGMPGYDLDDQIMPPAIAGTAKGFAQKTNEQATPTPVIGKAGMAVPEPGQPRLGGEMTLAQIVFSSKQLEGQRVITEGMVHRGGGMPQEYFILWRFLVICCAADARPIGIFVSDQQAKALPNNCWVRVGGIVRLKKFNGRIGVCLDAEKIKRRPEPPPEERNLY